MRAQVQLVVSGDEDITMVKASGVVTEKGETVTVTVGAAQLLFDGAEGVVPVQVVPSQAIVPLLFVFV